jgi:hypothetical protein
MQSSDAMRRESADAHPYSTVMPAKAGIQYPAASRLKHCRLWNTGSSAGACHRAALCADPVADDDNGKLFEN